MDLKLIVLERKEPAFTKAVGFVIHGQSEALRVNPVQSFGMREFSVLVTAQATVSRIVRHHENDVGTICKSTGGCGAYVDCNQNFEG